MESVFTSTTDHTKANLSFVRGIRNKATHNILPDYDFKFSALFQCCVYNFNAFVKKHFIDYKMNNQITAFVALSNVPDELNTPLSLNPASLFHLSNLEPVFNKLLHVLSADYSATLRRLLLTEALALRRRSLLDWRKISSKIRTTHY